MAGANAIDRDSPTKLGKYELYEIVGRGSVGIVYKGWDTILRRVVAIKTFPLVELDTSLGREKYERFQREAQAAARLHHPNVAITFDYGETESIAFIAMEFLEGLSLKGLIEKGSIKFDRIPFVMKGLLSGLAHSHHQGVIHRDIKPANILFDRDGNVKITDFGIAHLDDSSLTQVGSQVGTPAYMSPEQVLGEKADARSDLYSAGVVLFEMLTGRRPFEGSTSSIMHKIIHAKAPRVSETTTLFSPSVDAVVAKALAKEPGERYQTAEEFWGDLAPGFEDDRPGTSGPPSDTEATVLMRESPAVAAVAQAGSQPWLPSVKFRRWVLPGGLATGALIACGLAVAWWSQHDSPGTIGTAVANRPLVSRVDPAGSQKVGPANTGPGTSPTSAGIERVSFASKLNEVAATAPCSFVRVRGDDGKSVTMAGVTALGEASELEVKGVIMRAIAQLAPTTQIGWRVVIVPGPFCGVLDLVRPLTDPRGGEPTVTPSALLRTSDPVVTGAAVLVMPSFSGAAVVDAYSADGYVHHLYPREPQATKLAAGTEFKVRVQGQGAAGAAGAGLLIALASAEPLFQQQRPETEPIADYVKQLSDALARARGNHVPVVSDAAAIK